MLNHIIGCGCGCGCCCCCCCFCCFTTIVTKTLGISRYHWWCLMHGWSVMKQGAMNLVGLSVIMSKPRDTNAYMIEVAEAPTITMILQFTHRSHGPFTSMNCLYKNGWYSIAKCWSLPEGNSKSISMFSRFSRPCQSPNGHPRNPCGVYLIKKNIWGGPLFKVFYIEGTDSGPTVDG